MAGSIASCLQSRLAASFLLLWTGWWSAAIWAQAPDPQAASKPPKDPATIEPLKTAITVTGNVAVEAPASISVLGRQEIQETPGVNLDDRLRDVPGFSLFRRSSSTVANPTTQGISLRGIGSTGASRTLVLWDGFPLNDPFGGWVYWTRVAPDDLERVEISRGASTAIFGDKSMAGAITLFSREAAGPRLTARYEGGNRDSHDASAGYSQAWRRFAVSGHLRGFTTDGYYIVPTERRGRADSLAGVRFVSSDLRLDSFWGRQRVFLRADLLAEERENGTQLTRNSTGLGSLAMQYRADLTKDSFSLLAFHTRQQFHASFTALSADRNTERITFRQTVPSESVGFAGIWRHAASRWNVTSGADVFRVEGFSTDSLVPAGKRVGGGSQLQQGTFVQADRRFGWLQLFGGARYHFAGQGTRFFSPSAGVTAGKGRLRARASGYRGFRSATLNELFREFRAGNTVTQANPLLRPEVLTGVEAGFDWVGESNRIRITAFRNSLEDLITNVTLSVAPNLIVRQRRNALNAVSKGFEFDAQQRWRHWRGEISYLFVQSRYSTGERIPQVAPHQGSAQLIWSREGTLFSAGVRSFSKQYDDDRNLFTLPGFSSVQVVVSQRLRGPLSASVAFENLLNRRFLTGFTPTPTIGAPRLWRAGVRWDGGLRR